MGRHLLASTVGSLLLPMLLSAATPAARAQAGPSARTQPMRFVLIPKLPHPWFDAVREGADTAARMIAARTGRRAVVDYQPPARAEIALQEAILQEAIRSRPDGITIDLLDAERLRPLLRQARSAGIAITVFDSEAPADLGITRIGNDYCQQARLASERLVQLLGGQGEVAIMDGVPTAPNHAIRSRCHREVFSRHPGIQVVASPADQDDIAMAERQARATMEAHPRLRGWVASDAGGGIGIARALRAMQRQGQVKVVGTDDLPEMLQSIRDGVVDSTAASRPRSQGYWSILSLWQQGLGAPAIDRIETGIVVRSANDSSL